MALPYTPVGIATLFTRLNAEATKKGFTALTRLTLAVEKQAKANVSYAPHKLGTPTPATPGRGPGLISGTLRRAITHTSPTPMGIGSWQSKVGMAKGPTAPYSKTSAAVVARILEKDGTKAGNKFPFLEPAVKFGRDIAGPVIYRDVFGRWPRMDL